MTIISFSFLVFIAAGAGLYYLLPHALQWVELLALSVAFYCLSAESYTLLYLAASAAVAYLATMAMEKLRERQDERSLRFVSAAAFSAIGINAALWFALKGRQLWAPALSVLGKVLPLPAGLSALAHRPLVAALGMGYYTAQVIGYIVDCYWGNVRPQRNPLKLFLFVCFFPQLTTGPISRYADLQTLYEKHRFNYETVTMGAQRMLWGLMKKLVLAERLGAVVSAIAAGPEAFPGLYNWVELLIYPLQVYADFSGCMDIVLGAAQVFDIPLAENFRNPFFARTAQEFWQRWHITLGTWAKDYILYPLLKTRLMIRFGKWARKKFGKRIGKFLATALGMFVLWMAIGVWHGSFRHIVGVSLWYWLILMLGELLQPAFKKATRALNIRTQSFSWHLFQSARTYLIYAVGGAFFNLGVAGGFALIKRSLGVLLHWNTLNPWIFFGEIYQRLPINYVDMNVLVVGMTLLVLSGILREKHGHARLWMREQTAAFRWFSWIALLLFVLIFGKYGPEYSASEFIYKGF